jgi:tetratricopeptide (TPR) repeat protein
MQTSKLWYRPLAGLGLLVYGLGALVESRRAGVGSSLAAPGSDRVRSGTSPTPSVPFPAGEEATAGAQGPRDGLDAVAASRRPSTKRSRARRRIGIAVLALAVVGTSAAPVVRAVETERNECDDAIAAASLLNDAGDYAGALAAFDAIVDECDGKSERIAIQSGRAHALNMLNRYDEALAASNAVLADDDEHLFGLFERAYANEHTGNVDAATADYQRIIDLTEKNENVKERATIYAKVADLYYKSGKTAEARTYLEKAMELDPANADFVIMEGDWALKAGDYAGADAAYNQATAMGVSGVEMYQIRAEASLKMVQDKYGTTNAQELRAQMTEPEKALVCGDLNRALALGWQNPQMDMFAALTCQ